LSSILKALKKVEQEESRDEKGAASWPDSLHSARQSVKQRSRKKLVVLLVAAAFCVVGAAMIYTGRNTTVFSTPDKKTDGIESGIKPGAEIEAGIPLLGQRPQNTASGTETNRPDKIPPKNREASIKALPVRETVDLPVSAKDADFSVGDAGNLSPDVTDKERMASLPELKHDSRIDIQAIAWAEEPDRRFAVINNSILREGGSVDGITVVSIEDGMVFFRENGNEWRQQFVVR
jgi:hypothetical protein